MKLTFLYYVLTFINHKFHKSNISSTTLNVRVLYKSKLDKTQMLSDRQGYHEPNRYYFSNKTKVHTNHFSFSLTIWLVLLLIMHSSEFTFPSHDALKEAINIQPIPQFVVFLLNFEYYFGNGTFDFSLSQFLYFLLFHFNPCIFETFVWIPVLLKSNHSGLYLQNFIHNENFLMHMYKTMFQEIQRVKCYIKIVIDRNK